MYPFCGGAPSHHAKLKIESHESIIHFLKRRNIVTYDFASFYIGEAGYVVPESP